MKNSREVWEAAVCRLVKRHLLANPAMTPEGARRWIENRHEEIGAEMDAIEGPLAKSFRNGTRRRQQSERTGA